MAPSEAPNKGVGNGSSCLFNVAHVFTTHTQAVILTITPSVMSLLALLQLFALAWKYFSSGLMDKAIS